MNKLIFMNSTSNDSLAHKLQINLLIFTEKYSLSNPYINAVWLFCFNEKKIEEWSHFTLTSTVTRPILQQEHYFFFFCHAYFTPPTAAIFQSLLLTWEPFPKHLIICQFIFRLFSCFPIIFLCSYIYHSFIANRILFSMSFANIPYI